MQTRHLYRWKFSLIALVLLSTCGRVSANDKSIPTDSLKQQLAQLEEVWKAGNQFEYFVEMAALTERITQLKQNDESFDLALLLFESALDKKYNFEDMPLEKLYDCSNEDITTLTEIAPYLLIQEKHLSSSKQRHTARLLARYLGRLRKEQIKDFKERPTPGGLNSWIDGSGNGINAREDPILRQHEYDKKSNDRQRAINYAINNLSLKIISFLTEFLSEKDTPGELLVECIGSARLNAIEKQVVLNAAAAKKKARIPAFEFKDTFGYD
jgi:hypothetical protein